MTTFYFSRKTEEIHSAIKKHIAAAPHMTTIHLERNDFETLKATSVHSFVRDKKTSYLDYPNGYKIEVMPK